MRTEPFTGSRGIPQGAPADSIAAPADDFAGSAGPREHVLDPDAKSYAARSLRCRLGFHKPETIRADRLLWFVKARCVRCGKTGWRAA